MTILPKAIYKFNAIPIKILKGSFHRARTNNFKICTKTKKTLSSQNNFQKNRAGGITHLDFRQQYKVTVIKTVWYQHKNRHINQWNRIESPEINLCTYHQLIYNKGGKNRQWKKDSLFNKWCLENCTATWKRMKLKHALTPYTKINSKCKTGNHKTPKGKHRWNTL